jgi:ferredoxin-NADP reductase
MDEYIVKILKTEYVTHDVKRFTLTRPEGYTFVPGQATDVSINNEKWKNEKRPFTFTGLTGQGSLEFTIKIYREHDGVTKQLEQLKRDDEIIIGNPWGVISYKGPGVFIAGGAGITPFIAILRDLYKEKKIKGNTLIFSNKTKDDVIIFDELSKMLPHSFYNILTRENVIGFLDKRIDEDMLIDIIKDFEQCFYVCGPEKFVEDITGILERLGAKSESLVFEK